MKRKALVEAVARYVEGADEAATQFTADLAVREREQLENLHALIAKLRATLVPVEPAPEYHDALKAKLMAAWREQRRAELARNNRPRRFSWRTVVVWSFLPLAALAAFVVHGRTRAPQPRPSTLSS